MEKSRNQRSLNAAKTLVQQERLIKGKKFEQEMNNALQQNGLCCSKKSCHTPDGTFISDHFYEVNGKKFWIESKTMLSTEYARELVNKKKYVQLTDPSIDNWIIFLKDGKGTGSRKNVKAYIARCENAGYQVIVGYDAINKFIKKLSKNSRSIAFDENGFIRKPKLMYIPIDKIKSNTTNRKIDPKAKEELKKSILHYGFLTQINVVPEVINGELTGFYLEIEGHHRTDTILDIMKELGIHLEDDKLPCVVVDWVTTENPQTVHELLVTLNTTTQPWIMEDYVKSHYDAAESCNDSEKQYSYGILKWMYKESVKNSYKKSKLFYILGPVSDSNKATSKWIDREMIKNGEYRITEKEFETKMKPFTENHLIPFIDWHMKSDFYIASNTTVPDVFMKTLFYDYLRGKMSDAEVIDRINAFKEIPKDSMPSTANESEFGVMLELIENKVSKKKPTTLKVKAPKKMVNRKTKV